MQNRMRAEGFTGISGQVAHHLHPPKPMGKKRGLGTGVYRPGRGGAEDVARILAGLNRGQSAPRRPRRAKKNGGQAIGRTRGGWNTKIHVVAASDTVIAGFLLSCGNESDANAGRLLLETLDPRETAVDLAMDRAYSDNLTRMTAWSLRYNPIVPPKRNRRKPWAHDAEAYRKRNEVERFFRRLKTYRAVATRYDKLDLMFSAFIWIACICILLRSVNTP